MEDRNGTVHLRIRGTTANMCASAKIAPQVRLRLRMIYGQRVTFSRSRV